MSLRRIILIALGLAILALARPGALDIKATSFATQGLHPKTEAERGAVAFAVGGWDALTSDTLQTSGAPWKLVNAAMALQAADGDATLAADVDINALYQQFGFHVPDTLANWPATLKQPKFSAPLGQNVGLAQGVWPPIATTIGNIGCAACHSSVSYDATGTPDTKRVWLGMPNTSINLESYTDALFTALRDYTGDADKLMKVVEARDPDTSLREGLTLQYAILPRVVAAIDERDQTIGRLLPHRASIPGATNGLDSLRQRLGLQDPTQRVAESTFNSVPDLGGRLYRRKLLNTGSYVVPSGDHLRTTEATDLTDPHLSELAGIIAYFTVPSMGVSDEVALGNIATARDVVGWMTDYAPQPYPAAINTELAQKGAVIFADTCASCHGTHDAQGQLISFPNWEGDVGTDPERARLVTKDLVDAVNGSGFGAHITARTVDGYTAPPLVGIWASAPYLHNASVPTLWHLMRPDQRPVRFAVGGHRLDMAKVGIDLSPDRDYVPWALSETIDTADFGLSNVGHNIGFDGLDENAKVALLEYLKTF